MIIPLLFLIPTFSFAEEDFIEEKIPEEEIPEEEPVIITKSDRMSQVIFDGKWSNDIEWKSSTYHAWKYDNGHGFILRSAHQDDHLYFLLDFVSDRILDTNMDRAVLCLESNNEKNLIAQNNSHCFVATLNSNNPKILQGGSVSAIDGHFKKIQHEDVIAVGTVSDLKDRYSPIPHPSYEFKIPTDLVGRYNEYGLYIAVYDYHNDKLYSWPRNIELNNNFQIPSPSEWGVLISPDRSLPEFEFPLLLCIISFLTLIYFSNVCF